MTKPSTKVFITFPTTTPGFTNDFRLDDVVSGRLDTASYTLAGLGVTAVDVTNDLRSVSIRRGKSFQLEKFDAGQSTVTLDNTTRKYDPVNALTIATRRNLIANPSFEANTTGWSSSATVLTASTATLSRSPGRAMFGQFAASVVSASANDGIHTIVTGLTASTTYCVTAYAYVIAGSGVRLVTRDVTNGITGSSSDTASAYAWTRLSSSLTTGASATSMIVALRSQGAGTRAFIDAVVAETASAGYYFDGGVADGRIISGSTAWTGTANNSSSSLNYRVPGTGSPFWPNVRPRIPISVTVGGSAAFTGKIEDWDFDYARSNDSVAVAKSADGFTELARTEVQALTASVETSGARIARVLDRTEVNWPASLRAIQTGDVTLDNASITTFPINTLEYLQQIEQAELGSLFINKSGSLQFIERVSATNPFTTVQFGPSPKIPFTDIQVSYGTELLKNRVTINRPGQAIITVSDTNSITDYGVVNFDLANTLLADDTQATALATAIVTKYSQPTLRITRVTTDLAAITDAQVSSLIGLEIGDVVTIDFTPNKIGAAITQVLVIDAIEHEISASRHLMSFNFSETTGGFVLNSSVWGVLNEDTL